MFNRASVCPVVIVIVVVVGMDVVSNTKRVVSDSKCPAIDSNRRRAVYADTIAAISSIQILFNRTGVCPVIVAVMVIVGVQVNSVVRSVCDSKCPAAESNKRTIVVLGDINSGNAVFNRASVCPVVIVIVVVVGMDVVSNTKRVVSDSKCPAIDSNRRRAVYADTIAAISSIQILFNRTGVCPVIVAVMVIVGVQVNSVVRSVCEQLTRPAQTNNTNPTSSRCHCCRCRWHCLGGCLGCL